MLLSRREFILGLLASTAYGSAAYAHWIEPYWVRVVSHEIPWFKTPGPRVRIVHLADLHLFGSMSEEFFHDACERVAAMHPDLIVVTGDFINGRIVRRHCTAGILSRLPRIAPVFATMGNHDGGVWSQRFESGTPSSLPLRDFLGELGVECLHNQTVHFDTRTRKLILTGLGDLWAQEFEPGKAFAGQLCSDTLGIVLSHNPDSKELLRGFSWHLMLSGHTHGSQLTIPFHGPQEFIVPVQDVRYLHGLKEWENRLIHVTAGVGSCPRFRLNCPPEISVLDLVDAPAA